MIPQWRTFLESNGAEFDDERLVNFGNDQRESRAALGGDIFCDLSHYRLLAIQGNDNIGFLQGQLTSDIEALSDERSLLAGFCTPKGRLISNFRLIRNGQTVFAILPEDMLQAVLTGLQHYVISADVQMGDASAALVHFGASGEKATQILAQQLGGLPADIGDVLQHPKHMVVRIAANRFEIFGNLEDCQALWTSLDVHCTAVGGDNWEALNIRDGIPDITAATTEAFVPQMVNLDLLGGINFEKGCYTGQEIVARTHYLGKQKRRMYRIGIHCDQAPVAGDELSSEGAGENQYTGTIVNAQADALDGYEALAVIDIKAAESGKLMMKGQDSKIELLDLPYSLQGTES